MPHSHARRESRGPLAAARRRFLGDATGLVAGAAALSAGSLGSPRSARAQGASGAFPSKPIKLIVPFATGSGNDLSARALAPRLGERLGQPVVVENRAGGGGSIATESVIKSPPDGHTLLLGTSSGMVMNLALYRNQPFNLEKDLTAVGVIARTSLALLAHPSAPGATFAEMVAYAKANPGKLTYGSAGNGSISHIVPEYMKRLAGVDILHVPYRGNGPAVVDLLAGQIHMVFDSPLNGASYGAKGQLKVYGVGGEKRHPALPNTPTFIEAGYREFDPYTWNSIMAHSGTPRPILERLNRELNAVLQEPETAANLTRSGGELFGPTSLEKSNELIAAERARWVPLVRSLNITLD